MAPYPYPEEEQSTKKADLPHFIGHLIGGGVGWGICACPYSPGRQRTMTVAEAKSKVGTNCGKVK